MSPSPQSEGVLDGMAGLMSQDAHAPFWIAPFHFQHLGQFELGEPGVGQIKRNRDAWHIIRTEPFIRQPKMGMKVKTAAIQFMVKLRDAIFKIAACNLEIEVAQPKIQQLLIRPRRPIGEIAPYGIGGCIFYRLALVLSCHRSGKRHMAEEAWTLYVLEGSPVDPPLREKKVVAR